MNRFEQLVEEASSQEWTLKKLNKPVRLPARRGPIHYVLTVEYGEIFFSTVGEAARKITMMRRAARATAARHTADDTAWNLSVTSVGPDRAGGAGELVEHRSGPQAAP
jgi:hypothetical protein